MEELLAERGITLTYETVRQWCQKFGPEYAKKLKKRQGRLGDTWLLDLPPDFADTSKKSLRLGGVSYNSEGNSRRNSNERQFR